MANCLAVQSVINMILQSKDREKKKDEVISQINDGVKYKEIEEILEREG